MLAGGAGVGKSWLAVEYTYRHGGAQGLWSTAGADVTQTLAGLAESLGIEVAGKSDENVAQEVRAALAGMTEGTLWVVGQLAGVGPGERGAGRLRPSEAADNEPGPTAQLAAR